MSENENTNPKFLEENSENSFFFEPNNEYEFEEEPKTPEMNINLNNDNYNKDSLETKNNENNKEESTSNMIETKITSKIGKNNKPKIFPHITNICVTVNLHCQLNLRKIAKNTLNSEYNPKKSNFLKIRINGSKSYANFSESGKMVCSGVKSEEELTKTLIKYDNKIKRCGFSTKLNLEEISINYISATYDIKFGLPLSKLLNYLNNLGEDGVNIHYEPELFPGLIYSKKVENSNMTLTFFASGKFNITGAKNIEHIYNIFDQIYPELLKFKSQL